ncbi:MAG: hypothetical protein QOE45_392 [Frankiaceae bacterium]|jgi:hypothetical protein|nr:hypothetical protein [Frankiaceae bacterium]
MRWPWRRRGSAGRVVFIGTSPFDVAAVIAAVPTPSRAVEAFLPAPGEPDARVRLGFADGTTLALEPDDPRAVALFAAAARLTEGP